MLPGPHVPQECRPGLIYLHLPQSLSPINLWDVSANIYQGKRSVFLKVPLDLVFVQNV